MQRAQCVAFLQWALPQMRMRWAGFRRVRSQVCKRIGRRRRELGLDDLDAYRAYLKERPDEWQRLDAMCRITISRFLRDRGVFEALSEVVLPALIVSAREGSGVSLFLVPAGIPGVSRHRIETMDLTRQQAVIRFDGARVPASSRIGAGGSGTATLDTLYDVAAALLAFEQVGGAQRCMEMSVEYSKERLQFGRPVAQFQAVRHRLADVLVAVEALDSALTAARDEPRAETAALAKGIAGRAYGTVARHCQQVLAGVGFTTDYPFQRFLKRALVLEGLFGSADEIALDVGRRLLAAREAPPLIEL